MPETPNINWIKNIFSLESTTTNKTWNTWVDVSLRSSQDLLEMAYDHSCIDEYRKRALFLLLTPNTRLAPFLWKSREPFHYLNSEIDFRKLSPPLRAHTIHWLVKFIDYVHFSVFDLERKFVILEAYNNYLLQLLSLLPLEDNEADTVFSYLSINDTVPWQSENKTISSGYTPVKKLWGNPQIPDKWKKLADSRMRIIIQSELKGKTAPRLEHENALKCYTKHIQALPLVEQILSYDKDFLADQIKFIISLEVSNQNLIQLYSLSLILQTLKEEKYKELRHSLVRFALLRDGNFKVNNEETKSIIENILNEFHQDGEVVKAIQNQIENYNAGVLAEKIAIETKKKVDESLLEAMKKPIE